MALPKLSDAERKKALAKAQKTRAERAKLCKDLKAGKVKPEKVLKSSDIVAGRMKVTSFLKSLPGVGAAKANKMLQELKIDSSRRLQGLGTRQRDELLDKIK